MPGPKYYLKAAAPGYDVEAKLLGRLCKWLPRLIVELVAIDCRRGWILTRDAGRPLREVAATEAITKLERLLVAYAEMQIAAIKSGAPDVKSFLEDRGLARLLKTFKGVINEPQLLAAGGATGEELQKVSGWVELCRRLCDRLTLSKLPMTLEHGDFHAGNILVAGNILRIADWGDVCWSHPFFSLVVCLNNARDPLALGATSSELERLKQAYFQAWRSAGIGADLEEAYRVCQQLRPAASRKSLQPSPVRQAKTRSHSSMWQAAAIRDPFGRSGSPRDHCRTPCAVRS
jgi:hypothetical protein